jgi:hypothetical protein
MKAKTAVRVVALLGLLAIVLGALLPAFSAWHS